MKTASLELYFSFVFIALLFGWGLKYYKFSKRKNLELIEYDELLNSSDEFFLYLRSFEDDGESRSLPTSMFTLALKDFMTYEEEIAKIFKGSNLIAVGKPNEKVPQLGAKRIYISDETWKEKVSTLADQAKIIIIKPSFSDGLDWEINLLMKKKLMSKTIFYLHFKNEDDSIAQKFYYNKFKKLFSEKFDIDLQDYSPKARFGYFIDNSTHRQARTLSEIPLIKKNSGRT